VAIGTETNGSITSPSAANSLVGLKPTVGLVSRSGIVPISHTQDTAGPMCRSVADAAVLLAAIAGADPRDVATQGARGADYVAALDANGLKGARIGVAREQLTGYSDAADAAFERALAVMKERGATIVDPANIATVGKFGDASFDVLLYEFKAGLERYLATRPPGVRARSLDALIAYNAPTPMRRCRTSSRRSSSWRRRRVRSRAPAIGRRSRSAARCRARRGSTRLSRSTASTRSSHR
jgi:amidase